MSSRATQTLLPNRQLDHVYDPVYTMSSSVDFNKAHHTSNVVSLPNYRNMFATGKNYSSAENHIREQHVAGTFHQQTEVAVDRASVGGADRWKFFRRPLVPFLSNFIYMKKEPQQRQRAEVVERPVSPLTKATGVQTLYRESEAQTDPYSPDYVVPVGLVSQPEVLALATLTYGQGLPVGPAELEMIERARAKRVWEAALPPVTDAESYQKRLKMMEEMELKEWEYREAEIKRLQDARIDILKKVIRNREAEIEDINRERMGKIWQKKLQEREALREKIEKKKAKILRKLAAKRKNPENRAERRDIIAEYADFGAKMPEKMREGFRNDKAGTVIPRTEQLFQAVNLDTALLDFDANLPEMEATLPADKAQFSSYKKEQHLLDQLDFIETRMKEQKTHKLGVKAEDPLRFLIKVPKPVQRPVTPQLEFQAEDEERREMAAITLQRLLRGRLAQNSMFQGKERRMELINELRIRRSLQSTGDLHEGVGISMENSLESELHDMSIKPDQDGKIAKLFETAIQAEYVGLQLDFISKELVRLREEKRIDAMVKLAERTRKMREADETGRRAAELERRQREDLLFAQTMGIHQETVDSYLEDVILASLDQTSSTKARDIVQQQADKLDSVLVHQQKTAVSDRSSEFAVADLMSAFLFPEVEREAMRDRVRCDQRRFLLAAHQAVHGALSDVTRGVESGSKKN